MTRRTRQSSTTIPKHLLLFDDLQEKLRILFHNKELLIQAFTHSSYVNEHRKKTFVDNERLEFLGDAVLELTISEFLFNHYPKLSEGELTKLRASIVCESSFARFANELSFGKFILLGKGEEMTGGRSRPAMLADIFEAFVGALFLDQGMSAVQQFLQKTVYPKIASGEFLQEMDYKSELQELIQQDGEGQIAYKITEERGPAHNREFVAVVTLDGKKLGTGIGTSKKEAEQKSAEQALQKLIKRNKN